MAHSNDRNGIKFIWKIKNFSCFENGILRSPSFPWNSTTWEVTIHLTEAAVDSDSYSVKLQQIKVKCPYVYCSLAFLDSQGLPLVWKGSSVQFSLAQNANNGINSVYFKNFIKMEEIFGSRRNEFLPNDILTVQCHIWVNASYQFIENVPLIAHTQIEPLLKVTKKSFTWDVTNITPLREMALERMESMPINGKPLVMRMILDSYFNLRITVSLFPIHLKVTVSMYTSGGKKRLVKEEFEFEENGQEWNLGSILLRKILQSYVIELICQDTIKLHFSCTLSGHVTFNSLVEEDDDISEPGESENETMNRSDHSDTVSKAIEDLYKEGFLSDFDIRVRDRLFHVHKNILGMRSPVFRMLFTTEMEDNEGNCAVIEGVDEDTFESVLQFIYSDKVDEDMDWDSYSSLYMAADMFGLETLKQRCSDLFRSCLHPDSVLMDILNLVEMNEESQF